MNIIKKPKNIKIVYFSGTGGTAKIAGCFAGKLKDAGTNVTLVEITSKTQVFNEFEDMLIVFFPVYAFNAPSIVHEYLNKFKKVINIPAAVISVSGGGDISPNTACKMQTIKQLGSKGYNVFYEKMLVMPSNFATPTPDDLSVRLIEIMPEKVQSIVDDILSGKTLRKKPHQIDKLLSYMGRAEKYGASYFGKYIKNSYKCTGCGLCAKSCPSDNIMLNINNRPKFSDKCITCFKCIYNCPQNALTPGIGKFAILKDGYSLQDIEKRMNGIIPKPIKDYEKNSLFSGVVKYLKEQ